MKKAFTLIELLLVLFITPLVINLSLGLLNLMQEVNLTQQESSLHEILRLQLRQLLLRSTAIECDRQTIYFKREDKEFMIFFDNQRLVQSPGYEIMMQDIDFAYFSEKEGVVLHYSYQGKEYQLPLQVGTCPYL